jgi:archaellum component FlaC
MADLNDIIKGLIDTDAEVISKLKAKANSLTTSVNNLTTSVNSLTTSVNNVTSTANTNKTNISKLQTDVNTLKTNVTSLTTTANTNKSDIATLKTNVTNVTSTANTNKSDIATLKTNVTNVTKTANTNKTDISTLKTNVSTINSNISGLNTKIEQGSGTYAIVNINTAGRSGSGTVTTDSQASTGKCIKATSGTSNKIVFQATFPAVNLGYYGLCARVKVNNSTSTSSIIRIRVLHGATEIATKSFTGVDIGTTDYTYLYVPFKYDVKVGASKGDLIFQAYTLTTASIDLSFDYAYISMMIPSVFM